MNPNVSLHDSQLPSHIITVKDVRQKEACKVVVVTSSTLLVLIKWINNSSSCPGCQLELPRFSQSLDVFTRNINKKKKIIRMEAKH